MQLLEAISPAMKPDKTAAAGMYAAPGVGDFLAVLQSVRTQVADATEAGRHLADAPARRPDDDSDAMGAEVLLIEGFAAILMPEVVKHSAAETVATKIEATCALPLTTPSEESEGDGLPATGAEIALDVATPLLSTIVEFDVGPLAELGGEAVGATVLSSLQARPVRSLMALTQAQGDPAQVHLAIAKADGPDTSSAVAVVAKPHDGTDGLRPESLPARDSGFLKRTESAPSRVQPVPPAPDSRIPPDAAPPLREFRVMPKLTANVGPQTATDAADPVPTYMADGWREPDLDHLARPLVKPMSQTEPHIALGPRVVAPEKDAPLAVRPGRFDPAGQPSPSESDLTGTATAQAADTSGRVLVPAAALRVGETPVSPAKKAAASGPPQRDEAGATLMFTTGHPPQTQSHAGPTGSTPHLGPPQADWAQSAVRQLTATVARTDHRPIEVTLSPDELGKVRMTFAATDGALSLTLVADRPQTLDLMRRNIDQLAQEFRALGYQNLNFSFAQNHDQRHDQPQGDNRSENLQPAICWSPPDFAAPVASRENGGVDLRL